MKHEAWRAILLSAAFTLPACAPSPEPAPAKQAEEQDEPHDGEKEVVAIDPDRLGELGIELRAAGPERVHPAIALPGEITLDPDRVTHVVPRVEGIVREVFEKIGDRVEPGQLLAVLESRELAAAKGRYLAASARLELAQATHDREKSLWEKQIGAEQDYLTARSGLEEARISLRESRQTLLALGLTAGEIETLEREPDSDLTRHEMRAPLRGEVIERHIVKGELLDTKTRAFTIADLSKVWVDLTVWPRHFASVRVGLEARIDCSPAAAVVSGRISYVAPLLEEATRTSTARVVLENPDGELRPGLFITAEVLLEEVELAVAVPREALARHEDRTVLFVETPEGFEAREVEVGRTAGGFAEITSGLATGDRYVAKGSFSLASELAKAQFGGEGHSH